MFVVTGLGPGLGETGEVGGLVLGRGAGELQRHEDWLVEEVLHYFYLLVLRRLPLVHDATAQVALHPRLLPHRGRAPHRTGRRLTTCPLGLSWLGRMLRGRLVTLDVAAESAEEVGVVGGG